MLTLIIFQHEHGHTLHSFCEVSQKKKKLMIIAVLCLLFSRERKKKKSKKKQQKTDFFMLTHREVAMYTNEKCEYAHICASYMCLLDISGCGAHSGGPPKRKMNSSGRVMWVSRPFRFNYELITRQDHSAGRRAGSWGGETKENNNRERIEGWKVLLKPFSSSLLSYSDTVYEELRENITHRHLTCRCMLGKYF